MSSAPETIGKAQSTEPANAAKSTRAGSVASESEGIQINEEKSLEQSLSDWYSSNITLDQPINPDNESQKSINAKSPTENKPQNASTSILQKTPLDQQKDQQARQQPVQGFINKYSNAKVSLATNKSKASTTHENILQKEESDNEEELIQTKGLSDDSNVQNNSGLAGIEDKLNSSSGQGSLLPDSTKATMGDRFGANFSSVRVHTDSNAVQMSRELNAQAFTHGNDIYFNSGKYNPDTPSGQHLLAHELTHTLQQSSQQPLLSKKDETDQDDKYTFQEFQPIAVEVAEGGVDVNKIGIIQRDQEPEVHLRSKPDSNSDSITQLPFNTRLQVIKEYPSSWSYVTTTDGLSGYVSSVYIKKNLPEPNAILHRVQSGVKGYAISIAESYYSQYSDNWGQDLRFYVNVLAYVNNIPVPKTTNGWKSVSFQAGNFIWIPSVEFAKSLVGFINSGSISYEIASDLGVAKIFERMGQFWDDLKSSISLSTKYIPDAVLTHVGNTLINILISLAIMLVGAVALLAISTAIGAIVGAIIGEGVGAIPGAEIGFEVGLVLLEWIGLGFLIYWIGTIISRLASSFGTFISTVWDANGDEDKIDKAAQEFAEAIATLCDVILEALVMYAVAKGTDSLLGMLKGTKLGKAAEDTAFVQWLKQRVENVKAGKTPIPTPKTLFVRVKLKQLYKGTLSPAEQAQIGSWGKQLQDIVAQAVKTVDSGQASSKWAQIFYGTSGSGKLAGSPMARGNAIHYEAFDLIKAAQFDGNPQVLVNAGRTSAGFPNSFSGKRPDIRFALTGGREAIFDITTEAQFGHSSSYASKSWVESLFELLYK